jgi:hypothetical protein
MRYPVLSADALGNGPSVDLDGQSPTCTKKLATPEFERLVCVAGSGI